MIPSLRKTGTLRILDLDIENRPLSYGSQDFTFGDITAIAASWVGEKKVHVWLLGEASYEEMLTGFCGLYDQAGIVTGHYLRVHDLPMINGALLEHGLPGLRAKLASDTKQDLVRRAGVSVSQESLAGMLGVAAPKEHMTQVDWRAGNRLLPEGLGQTRRRVVGDVVQHKQMRVALLERGLLRPPRIWSP